MSMDLKFEEEQIRPVRSNQTGAFVYNRYDARTRIPPIIRFLMRARLVRSEKQARVLVISICTVLCLIAIFVISRSMVEPEIVRLQLSK